MRISGNRIQISNKPFYPVPSDNGWSTGKQKCNESIIRKSVTVQIKQNLIISTSCLQSTKKKKIFLKNGYVQFFQNFNAKL